MAIINSKGEIRGKVGNVVYKVVNGKTVIASLPRRKKGGFKPEARHERFKLATKMSSRVYRELKQFFLNLPPSDLSNKLTSLFIHSHEELFPNDPAAGWTKIPHEEYVRFPKRVHPYHILFGTPSMEIEGEQAIVNIPSFTYLGWPKKRHYRMPYDVESLENAVILIRYDFDTESTQVIFKWESERNGYRRGEDNRTHLHSDIIDIGGNAIENGLLIAAFNMRAFASDTSTAYLNSKKFNPLSILGVWVKG